MLSWQMKYCVNQGCPASSSTEQSQRDSLLIIMTKKLVFLSKLKCCDTYGNPDCVCEYSTYYSSTYCRPSPSETRVCVYIAAWFMRWEMRLRTFSSLLSSQTMCMEMTLTECWLSSMSTLSLEGTWFMNIHIFTSVQSPGKKAETLIRAMLSEHCECGVNSCWPSL